MSKKKITRLQQPKPDKPPEPTTGSTKLVDSKDNFSSDLEIALSKARAASLLLKAIPDYLQIPDVDISDEEEKEAYGWIENIAQDALDAALKAMEDAREKFLGPSVFRKKAVAS